MVIAQSWSQRKHSVDRVAVAGGRNDCYRDNATGGTT